MRIFQLFILFLFTASNLAHALDEPFAAATWANKNEIYLSIPGPKYLRADVSYFIQQSESSGTGAKAKNSSDLKKFQNLLPLSPLSTSANQIIFSTKDFQNKISDLIRGPLSLVAFDSQNKLLLKTNFQLAPLLDEEFSTTQPLGTQWIGNELTLRLWAPTAKSISILFFDQATSPTPYIRVPLAYENGTWTFKGTSKLKNSFYLYEVEVFSPHTGKMEKFSVTDPYSISLSENSQKSQIVNPEDPALKPSGWDDLQKPALKNFSEIVVYESHIRDLTAKDAGLKPQLRGTFLGLSSPDSLALKHLSALAQAGLTHLHLLPVMDFATVSENRNTWKELPFSTPSRPQSTIPQDELDKIKDLDSYNWGYDPVHYMTPEGSYTTNPNGAARILELRSLVQALNKNGLRLILDLVFNHTFSHGIENFSVFDRIVPLYYYRLNKFGDLHSSSCCSDLATEHKMLEKLMVDSVVYLAKTFKIDGFRFDLMNLHTANNMKSVKDALRSLSLKNDKVDGSKIYLYGEAWPFGSLEEKYSGEGFFQTRTYGKGYGVFNDRMRDAIRGGTTDSREKSDQGFATGLFYDFNEEPANKNTPTDLEDQRWKLLHLGDVIKIGLAGNLRDYMVRDHRNNFVKSGELFFRNNPVGYAAEPTETINYVSAHDGYALWDAIQAKLPFYQVKKKSHIATEEEKVRSQQLMLAIVALSQGIPFFEGGSEILRSKSGDVDSYNSGDWFNALDFSLNWNNWGAGLPPHWRNLNDWSFWQPRLENQSLGVSSNAIHSSLEYFKALLKVRKSNPLFHLNNLNEIQNNLSFPTDDRIRADIPGFLVLKIEPSLLIFFNATNSVQSFYSAKMKDLKISLHSDLNEKVDPALKEAAFNSDKGIFQIPARSTAIFEVLQ